MKIVTSIIVILFLLFNSCYTAIETIDTKPKKKFIYPGAIIEGRVEYFYPPINRRPSPRFNKDNASALTGKGGFVLVSYNWFITSPREFFEKIYLEGNIDNSYDRKWVQIKGHYEIRKTYYPKTGHSKQNLHLYVEKIYVME